MPNLFCKVLSSIIIALTIRSIASLKSTKYTSWYVSAQNGILSAMPLPHGFYPSMDIGEFTKRFDSVLDLLYGTDTLKVGRHFLKERNT